MRIFKSKGRFNMCSNEEQWQAGITGLPEDAPHKGICQTWDIDDEPYIEGEPPSEVIEIISERVESYWISTSRKKDRETIQWIRDNIDRLNALWAKDEIEKREKRVKQIQVEIKGLTSMIGEVKT